MVFLGFRDPGDLMARPYGRTSTSLAFRQFFMFLTFGRFPGVWRCARGGFRHAESEYEVKNEGKQPPEEKKKETRDSFFFFFFLILFFLGAERLAESTV